MAGIEVREGTPSHESRQVPRRNPRRRTTSSRSASESSDKDEVNGEDSKLTSPSKKQRESMCDGILAALPAFSEVYSRSNGARLYDSRLGCKERRTRRHRDSYRIDLQNFFERQLAYAHGKYRDCTYANIQVQTGKISCALAAIEVIRTNRPRQCCCPQIIANTLKKSLQETKKYFVSYDEQTAKEIEEIKFYDTRHPATEKN